MDINSALIFAGIVAIFIIAAVNLRRNAKKKVIAEKAALEANAAAWAIDPANSSSINYDPAAYDEWLSKQIIPAWAEQYNPRK